MVPKNLGIRWFLSKLHGLPKLFSEISLLLLTLNENADQMRKWR